MHFSEHTRTPGRHLSECLLIMLTEDQKIGLLPKLIQISRFLQGFKHNILRSVDSLIKAIEKEALEAFTKIKELQGIVEDLINDKGIEMNNYEIITRFQVNNKLPAIEKIDDIKTCVEALFKVQEVQDNSWKECNQIIFSRDIRHWSTCFY